MKPVTTRIAATAALLCISISASAQQAAAPATSSATSPTTPPATPPRAAKTEAVKPEAPAAELTKVEINAASEYDPRRDDTASKTVMSQEEIAKYGDTNVFDVLKRAPGVTVIGNSIRMRGLGNGYTQVLVNGESPPPGFSLDTLPPEQIEKIEIVRAASAEFSTRAIAGTVNIVLKKVVSKAQRDLRLNLSHSSLGDNQTVLGTLADRSGNLSYYLNLHLTHNANDYTNPGTEQFTAPDGRVTQLRDYRLTGSNKSDSLGLSPRLNWKLENGDQLNWNAIVLASRGHGDSRSTTVNRVGVFAAPDYVSRITDNSNDVLFHRNEINWIAKLAGGKLDAKLSASEAKFDSDSHRVSSTGDGAISLLRAIGTTTRHDTVGSSGKYSRSMFEGHALAAGWEVNRQKTTEDRLRNEGFSGATAARIVELFEPQVTSLAVFAQDEWNVNKHWSMYLGARWEGIRTESTGTGLQSTRSRSHVLSPIAQTLYKFPDKSGRQLRLALTRTYKAPGIEQLTARRNESDLNTRFNPDSSGNPDLQPELATGVDLTYEHFWAPGAMYSIGTSSRRITDYIRTVLTQDANGYWLYQPVNDGNAQVRSLDLELKFPLKSVWKEAPAIDLRASVNRNWSQVESVPGPDNRLDQQVPISTVLGADYKRGAYTVGANFAYRTGTPIRISEQQRTWLQPSRNLDAYVLYKISATLQLRMTVNNALAQDNRSVSSYEDSYGINQSWSTTEAPRRWSANLEIKL